MTTFSLWPTMLISYGYVIGKKTRNKWGNYANLFPQSFLEVKQGVSLLLGIYEHIPTRNS